MALPVLRHRLIPSFNAEAAGQTSDAIIRRLIEESAVQPPPITAKRPVILPPHIRSNEPDNKQPGFRR
jgi:hypothetical protein